MARVSDPEQMDFYEFTIAGESPSQEKGLSGTMKKEETRTFEECLDQERAKSAAIAMRVLVGSVITSNVPDAISRDSKPFALSKCPETNMINYGNQSVAKFLAQVQAAHVMSFNDIEVRLRAAKQYCDAGPRGLHHYVQRFRRDIAKLQGLCLEQVS